MSGRNNRATRNKNRDSFDSKNIKNILIIVGIVILFVLIIVFVCQKMKDKNVNFEDTNFSNINYEYFLLNSEKAIGVIDKEGNTVLETKYNQILIPNPEKDIFICYLDSENSEVLNKKGEKIFNDFENIETIESETDNPEVEKNVLKYKKDDMYGLVDLDGNKITEPIYNEIRSLNYRPGRILVKQGDNYGILDSKGNTVIEVKYNTIEADGYYSQKEKYEKTGYIVSEKASDGINYGYINSKGKMLLDTKYESIQRALEYDRNEAFLIAMQKGKKGVFKDKKKIIDLNFQNIDYSDISNVFIVNKNGKYGFYNLDGKAILKPEYQKYSIAGNYISVVKDSETKLYDVNGNLVNTNSYKKMIETSNPAYFIAEDDEGYYSIISKSVNISEKFIQVDYAFDNYFIFTDENSKAGVINALTSEVEIEPKYDIIISIEGTKVLQAIDGMNNVTDIYSSELDKVISMKSATVENLEDNFIIIYSDNDMKYIDSNGKIVENIEVYPNKELYSIQKDGKWGFANQKEEVVVNPEYDIVTEFNKYGFAGIKKDGKWGVVKKDGTILVEPEYELEDVYYFPQFIGKYLLVQSEIVYCQEVK